MRNPWLSLWLSAANSWTGTMRGLRTAELHRQQTAAANEMIRQTMDFWTRTRLAPGGSSKRQRAAGDDQRSRPREGETGGGAMLKMVKFDIAELERAY